MPAAASNPAASATKTRRVVRPHLVLFAATVVIILLTLTGCGTTASDPVGIGTGPDRLKQSPCACTEILQVPLT